jgi:hypothetical protein
MGGSCSTREGGDKFKVLVGISVVKGPLGIHRSRGKYEGASKSLQQ